MNVTTSINVREHAANYSEQNDHKGNPQTKSSIIDNLGAGFISSLTCLTTYWTLYRYLLLLLEYFKRKPYIYIMI